MKLALVEGLRREAQPGLMGICPYCVRPVVARCGTIRIWHWSHKGRRVCDPWWENETEWHRDWKARFPASWQELVFRSPSGERHIADVKTQQGRVLEFQHSHLPPQEREAREAFYPKLAWVVDGTRRKKDAARLLEALNRGQRIHPTMVVVRVAWIGAALLRDWVASRVPVLFDLGSEAPDHLWCLAPESTSNAAYLARLSRHSFIETHLSAAGEGDDRFSRVMQALSRLAADDQVVLRTLQLLVSRQQLVVQVARHRRSREPRSFQQFLARQHRKRHRF